MTEQINNKGWFRDTLELLFEPDPYSRLSSQQIATIFNHYYYGLGLPDLSTDCREVGRWLAKYPDIGHTVIRGGNRYHLSLKADIGLPAELAAEIQASRLRPSKPKVKFVKWQSPDQPSL